MITVKNISSSLVVLSMPDIRFRAQLMPGRVIKVRDEDYESMMFDPGINTLINNHFIRFYGVEGVEASTGYEASEIRAMLEKQDITAFAKFIPNAAPAEKDAVIKFATELGITNNAFVALIKKYCDVDIISAINTKHLAEE